MSRVPARDAAGSWVPLLASAAVVLTAASARADLPVDAARYVYQRAAAEYDRGEFAAAAVDFADADNLVPNDVTLETAISSAIKGDAVVLGLELAERAKRSPGSAPLAKTAAAAREKFAARAGQIVVRCAPGCKLAIDGKPAAPDGGRWVIVGDHKLDVDVGHGPEARSVHVKAGEVAEVAIAATAANPAPIAPVVTPTVAPLGVKDAPPEQQRGGISPVWFFVGAGATAISGGLAIAFGVDTASKHTAFATSPTQATSAAGASAEARTNVMIGVTAGAAVATAAVGLFAVRWSSRGAPREASIGLHGAGLEATARY
ncbi:MAG TPA: hypothetical protein VGM56_19485 [Byssovorax sp.]